MNVVSAKLDDDLNRRLTNWMLRERRGSRSEAIRLLLTDALDAEDKRLVDAKAPYLIDHPTPSQTNDTPADHAPLSITTDAIRAWGNALVDESQPYTTQEVE